MSDDEKTCWRCRACGDGDVPAKYWYETPGPKKVVEYVCESCAELVLMAGMRTREIVDMGDFRL